MLLSMEISRVVKLLHSHHVRRNMLKRASSLKSRFIGKLRISDSSRDKEMHIRSKISSILLSSVAIIVNRILKELFRR